MIRVYFYMWIMLTGFMTLIYGNNHTVGEVLGMSTGLTIVLAIIDQSDKQDEKQRQKHDNGND